MTANLPGLEFGRRGGTFFARLALALCLLAPLDSTALSTIGIYDPVSAATDVHGGLEVWDRLRVLSHVEVGETHAVVGLGC